MMDVIGKIRGVCGGYVVETKGDVEKGVIYNTNIMEIIVEEQKNDRDYCRYRPELFDEGIPAA